MNDDVNVCSCPHCHYSFKAPYPFMYVDVNVGFAVWWEPIHDAGIDSDAVSYARMFGANSFYAKAPRIEDWNEFKDTIMKYYSGELVGGKIEKMDLSTLRKTPQAKGKGCMAQPTNPVECVQSLTQKHVAKRYMIGEKFLPLRHES